MQRVIVSALFTFVCVGTAVVAGGCTRCADICENFAACPGSTINEENCSVRCEDRADTDTTFSTAVDTCDTCLGENQTCEGGADLCAVECEPILAEAAL